MKDTPPITVAQTQTIHDSIAANLVTKTSMQMADRTLRDQMFRTLYELNILEKEQFRLDAAFVNDQHYTMGGISRPEYRGKMRDVLKKYGWEG